MNHVIAVFSSRSETLSFANMLRRMGVPSMVVQTPKEAGRTCGISVKFSYDNFEVAKQIFLSVKFMSFQGFYLEENLAGRNTFVRR